MRWIPRVALIALLALAGLYAGDYLSARYRIPGNRQTLGSVQVQTLYAVRLKDARIEYLLGDTDTETCVRSLFPQLGYPPCWYLSRHATRRIEISSRRRRPRLSRLASLRWNGTAALPWKRSWPTSEPRWPTSTRWRRPRSRKSLNTNGSAGCVFRRSPRPRSAVSRP